MDLSNTDVSLYIKATRLEWRCSPSILTAMSFTELLLSLLVLCLETAFPAHGDLSPVKDCGVSNVTAVGDRIVGGREAIPGEFPWQVSLRYSVLFFPSTHLCGATLLDQWWILTAAHCVHKRWKWNLSVAVGMYSQEGTRLKSFSIDKIVEHKKFDPDTFLNDIALIRVKKPIVLGGGVNTACLPQPGESTTGLVTASGWGAMTEDGSGSSVLMTVDLPVVPPNTCESIFDSYSTTAMLCAGFPEGHRDTCQGDSGGPLVQRRQKSTAILVGVVSSGVGCGRPGLPGVYTRVANYIDWINTSTT